MKLFQIPVINGLGVTAGCESAPEKVICGLKDIYLNESGARPVFDIEKIGIDQSNLEETNDKISKTIENARSPFVIIGGDHSLTYASFRGFSRKNRNSGLLVLDAHPDMENNFNPPTHEDFLITLIEEGHLRKENAVILGIRNWHINEFNYIRQNRIKIFTMEQIEKSGLHSVTDTVMESVCQFDSLYISIDIDVIDPGFAPGTGYIEPGGLSSREFFYLIHRLKNLRNIGAFDIVEINPKKDINGMTVKLGAKILAEMFGVIKK